MELLSISMGAKREQKGPMLANDLSCCRFDGHRVWVFHEAGGSHAETKVQSGIQA